MRWRNDGATRKECRGRGENSNGSTASLDFGDAFIAEIRLVAAHLFLGRYRLDLLILD